VTIDIMSLILVTETDNAENSRMPILKGGRKDDIDNNDGTEEWKTGHRTSFRTGNRAIFKTKSYKKNQNTIGYNIK
jgi:hypothetical protein